MDGWSYPGWKYVRSKVITFSPGDVKSCSLENLPELPNGKSFFVIFLQFLLICSKSFDNNLLKHTWTFQFFLDVADSGLVLNSSKAVSFGDFAVFHCAGNDSVTDDGFVFNLLCLPNGQFQKVTFINHVDKKLKRNRPKKGSQWKMNKIIAKMNEAEPNIHEKNARHWLKIDQKLTKNILKIGTKSRTEKGTKIRIKWTLLCPNSTEIVYMVYEISPKVDLGKKAKCRPRETCTKSPPRPPSQYGLARNYSRDIKEFGYASYSCINDNEVGVINTWYIYNLL